MTKARLFLLQLLAAAALKGVTFIEGGFEAASILALVVAAGALAAAISRRRGSLIISWTLAALTVALTVSAVTSVGPLGAGLCVVVGATLSFGAWFAQRTPAVREVTHKSEQRPVNPWNAIDQGIDPTE